MRDIFQMKLQVDIKATVFGGEDDYNVSAYDEDMVLNDEDMYIALPCRLEGSRPEVVVINRASRKAVVAEILDVGPWMIDDDYWARDDRPIAETYYCNEEPLPSGPNQGEMSNGAGIDLSPALAKALGIDGMGTVDWFFLWDGDE